MAQLKAPHDADFSVIMSHETLYHNRPKGERKREDRAIASVIGAQHSVIKREQAEKRRVELAMQQKSRHTTTIDSSERNERRLTRNILNRIRKDTLSVDASIHPAPGQASLRNNQVVFNLNGNIGVVDVPQGRTDGHATIFPARPPAHRAGNRRQRRTGCAPLDASRVIPVQLAVLPFHTVLKPSPRPGAFLFTAAWEEDVSPEYIASLPYNPKRIEAKGYSDSSTVVMRWRPNDENILARIQHALGIPRPLHNMPCDVDWSKVPEKLAINRQRTKTNVQPTPVATPKAKPKTVVAPAPQVVLPTAPPPSETEITTTPDGAVVQVAVPLLSEKRLISHFHLQTYDDFIAMQPEPPRGSKATTLYKKLYARYIAQFRSEHASEVVSFVHTRAPTAPRNAPLRVVLNRNPTTGVTTTRTTADHKGRREAERKQNDQRVIQQKKEADEVAALEREVLMREQRRRDRTANRPTRVSVALPVPLDAGAPQNPN